MAKQLVAIHSVENLIKNIRGKNVILDSDLAHLYQVPTKRLNEQIKRNKSRFPEDFSFQLTSEEDLALRSQIATSNDGSRGGRRYSPYVFTEHGVIMAANVLNSKKAIEVSLFVVRAFVKIREFMVSYKDLSRKLTELEQKMSSQDKTLKDVIVAIHRLMQEPILKKRPIGFTAKITD